MKTTKISTILVLRSELWVFVAVATTAEWALRRVALVLAFGLMVCLAKVSEAVPIGTVFTYQGRLMDANSPADGLYDFQFRLYDDPNVILGNQQGSTIYINDLDVIDGHFAVELDFGSDVFKGDARWLEIGVRSGDFEDPCEYTILGPRQKVTPTPSAIYAETAGRAMNDFQQYGRSVTYVVAASDSPAHVKSQADFLCDGTDDDVQIQAAIDAIGADSPRGGTVILHPGTYHCTSAINLRTSSNDKEMISLCGIANGIKDTWIAWADGTNCDGIIYEATTTLRGRFKLANMQLANHNDGSYWTLKITAIDGGSIYDCIFENLYVSAGGNSYDRSCGGCYIEADWASHFSRCTIEDSRGTGFKADNSVNPSFESCFFAANKGHGCWIVTYRASFVNCAFENNGEAGVYNKHGLYLDASGARDKIVNCYAADNYGKGFFIRASETTLTNCIAKNNGLGLSGGVWGAGGFWLTYEHIICVNCISIDNDTDVYDIGFYVDKNDVQLIGCQSRNNKYGVYLGSNADNCYIDVGLSGNTTNLRWASGATPVVFAERAYRTSVTTSAYDIEPYDNGKIYNAATTSNTVTFNLPPARPGLSYQFYFAVGANQMRIDPDGTDEIFEDNIGKGAGKYIYADAVGKSVKLKCITPNRWEMVEKIGTWGSQP